MPGLGDSQVEEKVSDLEEGIDPGEMTRQPHGPMGEGVDHEFPGGRGTRRSFLEEVQELTSLCTDGKRLGRRETFGGAGRPCVKAQPGRRANAPQESLGFLWLESPG